MLVITVDSSLKAECQCYWPWISRSQHYLWTQQLFCCVLCWYIYNAGGKHFSQKDATKVHFLKLQNTDSQLNLSSTMCTFSFFKHSVQLPYAEYLICLHCQPMSSQEPLLSYCHSDGRLLLSLHHMPNGSSGDASVSDMSVTLTH